MASVTIEISGTDDLDILVAAEVIAALIKLRCGIISIETRGRIVIKGDGCSSDNDRLSD